MEKAEKWSPLDNRSEIMKKYGGSFSTASMMDEVSVIGNIGDPTIATAEKGGTLVDTLVDEAAKFIADLKKL